MVASKMCTPPNFAPASLGEFMSIEQIENIGLSPSIQTAPCKDNFCWAA
jgi:hypothetical protein